jgi:hypothetical protein
MENLTELMTTVQQARHLQAEIENACFQAYCHIAFHASNWTWGTVTYRLEMSGKGYEAEFRNKDELIRVLNDVLKRARHNDCNSL